MIHHARLALACAALSPPLAGAAEAPKPATPGSVLEAAGARDWARFDPRDLVLMELADGGRVVIALAPEFAPVHVANIRALVRAIGCRTAMSPNGAISTTRSNCPRAS